MVAIVHTVMNVVFDVLLWPVQWLPAWLQLAWLGVPAALLGLVVFRYVSNQEGIERAKNRIKAHLLELRLYKDDLRVTLEAQGQILRWNARYLGYSLVPMAVMIVPFLLMIVQIESRFAWRGLAPGEHALLTVNLDDATRPSTLSAGLDLPQGVLSDTPPLRIDATRQIVWRLSGTSEGRNEIGVRLNGVTVYKRITIGASETRISPALHRRGDWSAWLYPFERPLESEAPIRSIELDYRYARSTFAGLSSATWIWFAASLLFGFALRGVLGVTF